jgi:uncharacterized protein YcbK (DUF882 family)
MIDGDFVTEHVRYIEVRCHSGADIPDSLMPNMREVCRRHTIIRAEISAQRGHDTPVFIDCGYRTPEYNQKLIDEAKARIAAGSKESLPAKHSMHMQAGALDVRIAAMNGDQIATLIEGLIRSGKLPGGGVGRYNTFCHFDIGRDRRWDYRTRK